MQRRQFLIESSAAALAIAEMSPARGLPFRRADGRLQDYRFDKKISRAVLENFLSRSITMEGLLNGRGDLNDNIRMLKQIGAKYIGRSICLWGHEAELLQNLSTASKLVPLVRAADPEIIIEACIFEIVTTQVETVPIPDWAFTALGLPSERRNFRYMDMLYPQGLRHNQWGAGASVPDVSQTETKLWFYFLARSYIDIGFEGIHFGQVEIMNHNDPDLVHWSQVLAMSREYATRYAPRHMLLCNAHVPSGGLVRDGRLLLDFHAFPLRVMEVPDKPQEGVLKIGYKDSIFGRSKGGLTVGGWSCEHLPYLVELDNYGVSNQPGKPGAGSFWVWGYDEISWFANQSRKYRAEWLLHAYDWLHTNDPNGHLEMPGSRTERSPLDHRNWYSANLPSSAVPDGLGDEVAIQSIWSKDRVALESS
jgi:hypothetical protein